MTVTEIICRADVIDRVLKTILKWSIVECLSCFRYLEYISVLYSLDISEINKVSCFMCLSCDWSFSALEASRLSCFYFPETTDPISLDDCCKDGKERGQESQDCSSLPLISESTTCRSDPSHHLSRKHFIRINWLPVKHDSCSSSDLDWFTFMRKRRTMRCIPVKICSFCVTNISFILKWNSILSNL